MINLTRLPSAIRTIGLCSFVLCAGCHGPGSPRDSSKIHLEGHSFQAIATKQPLPDLSMRVGQSLPLYDRRGVSPASFLEPVLVSDGEALRLEQKEEDGVNHFRLVPLKPGCAKIEWRDWMRHETLTSFTVVVHAASSDVAKLSQSWSALFTLLPHLLGLDHEHLTYRYAGRDFRLTDLYGNVVKDVMA